MAEIERVRHFGNVAAHEFGVAAVTVAGEHQRAATDGLARAVAALHLDALDEAIFVREERLANAPCEDRNIARLNGAAQPVDQFRSGAAREPVHAMRRMARI